MDRKRWRTDRKHDLDEMLPKATGRYSTRQMRCKLAGGVQNRVHGSARWLELVPALAIMSLMPMAVFSFICRRSGSSYYIFRSAGQPRAGKCN